jgi:hypothetical protein
VNRTLLSSVETRERRRKFLNEKGLNKDKEISYTKLLRCTEKDQIRNLGRYLDKVKY